MTFKHLLHAGTGPSTLILLLALATASGVAAQPPCCQLGDANDSGTVSAFDLVLFNKHILDIECLDGSCNGDVDGNGVVDETDLQLIQEYILGLRRTFPRCGDLDGDGEFEWPGDDLNCFTAVAIGGNTDGCFTGPVDANQDGVLDIDDIFAFIDVSNGE